MIIHLYPLPQLTGLTLYQRDVLPHVVKELKPLFELVKELENAKEKQFSNNHAQIYQFVVRLENSSDSRWKIFTFRDQKENVESQNVHERVTCKMWID